MRLKKTICTVLTTIIFVLTVAVSTFAEAPTGNPIPTGITSSDITTV